MNPMVPGESGRPEPSSQAHQDQVLGELAGVLADQKARAQEGDLQSVQELILKSASLLRELAEGEPLTPQSAGQLDEIAKAHRQVELILAAARQEAAGRLANLGRGKGALKGYRSL